MVLSQSLLGLAIAGGSAAAAALANRCITRFRLERAIPRISRVYGLLDPLFAEMSGHWSGSELRFACQILVALLADGKLSDREIRWAADQVIARFNPVKAADGARGFRAAAAAIPGAPPEIKVLAQVRLAVEQGAFIAAGAAAAARSIQTTLKETL